MLRGGYSSPNKSAASRVIIIKGSNRSDRSSEARKAIIIVCARMRRRSRMHRELLDRTSLGGRERGLVARRIQPLDLEPWNEEEYRE
jgi:hypothetical protein